MNLIPSAVKKSIMRSLRRIIKWLSIDDLGPKRPFMSLFVGAFLFTGFLPLLTYMVFVSVVVCLGVFLFVVIEGGIVTVATVVLMAALILPACIAGGLALFAYTVYAVFSQMKFIVVSAVNVPEKLLSGDRCTNEVKGEWLDEKPGFQGKSRLRRGRKVGKDSDTEADDASETKSTLLPGDQHKKSPVSPHPQWLEDNGPVSA